MNIAAFTRAWEQFNKATPFGAAMTKPEFAETVLKEPQLFAGYIVEAAKKYNAKKRTNRKVLEVRAARRLRTRPTAFPACGTTKGRWTCTLPAGHPGPCSWERDADDVTPRQYGDGS